MDGLFIGWIVELFDGLIVIVLQMGIQIRLATEADLPAMLEIYNDIILHTTAVYDYEPHSLDMRKQWLMKKKNRAFRCSWRMKML